MTERRRRARGLPAKPDRGRVAASVTARAQRASARAGAEPVRGARRATAEQQDRDRALPRPPHEGVLNYEAWQWPVTGRELCAEFDRFLRSGARSEHSRSA